VNWLLNGQLIGNTSNISPTLRLQLHRKGPQALTAMDAMGQYQQVVFSVR
jgi:membrane carboxypeptidase/penicillin-binding protein PbpC